MANKKDGIEIVRVGIILFAITAVAAAILAGVNRFTAPVIAENNKLAQEKAMKAVLPGATEFVKKEYSELTDSIVSGIYKGSDIGYVVNVNPNGYGGTISLVVGVDNECKVTGVEVISQSETAGLGSNCTKDDFKAQFVGKTENIEVVKNNASENQIDAISSATITSKAVTKGVNTAILAVKTLKGGE